jgi:hypothetical protein
MEAHLGVCEFIPSHFHTLPGTWNVTPRLHFWPSPLQALVLVASPRLRLRQEGFKGGETNPIGGKIFFSFLMDYGVLMVWKSG